MYNNCSLSPVKLEEFLLYKRFLESSESSFYFRMHIVFPISLVILFQTLDIKDRLVLEDISVIFR